LKCVVLACIEFWKRDWSGVNVCVGGKNISGEFIALFARECEFIILFAYFVISCAANLIFEVNYT